MILSSYYYYSHLQMINLELSCLTKSHSWEMMELRVKARAFFSETQSSPKVNLSNLIIFLVPD